MYLLHSPTAAEIRQFRERQHVRPVFQNVGDIPDPPPRGYRANVGCGLVGAGAEAFHAACQAVRHWEMFPVDWVRVETAEEPVSVGVTATVIAPCLGIWTMNCCRVVDVVEADRRFAFTYATTDEHSLAGVEEFAVEWRADDTVWFRIHAIARPRDWLARLGWPLVRRLQRRFAKDAPLAVRLAVERRLAFRPEGSETNGAR